MNRGPRRMSLERLALCHLAVAGRGSEVRAVAREAVGDDYRGILVGQSFAETLELSRPLLDLYEEKAHVSHVVDVEFVSLPGEAESFSRPAAFSGAGGLV
jgi:hypothetical protein